MSHADAALSPLPNEILHTKVVSDGFVAEWWQLTSLGRRRERPDPPRPES